MHRIARHVAPRHPASGSVTTMGYGDIVPVTNAERIFTLGVALVGAVVFSYCMGSVASLITQARAQCTALFTRPA